MIYGCGIFNKLCVLVSRHVEDVTVFMVTKHVVLKYGITQLPFRQMELHTLIQLSLLPKLITLNS